MDLEEYSINRAKSFVSSETFEKCVSSFKDWEKISLEEKQNVSNLLKEHFLDGKTMAAFLKDLATFSSISIPDHVYLFYKENTLKGGKPTFNKVFTFGFSLTEWQIKTNLRSNYLWDVFGGEESEIDEFVTDIKNGTISPEYESLNIKAPDSLIWITFSEKSSNPFDFIKLNIREEIFIVLAVSEHYVNDYVYMFTLKNKAEVIRNFKKPTVFDAGGYHCFRPTELSENNYGYTFPHNDGNLISSGYENLKYERVPEVICSSNKLLFEDIKIGDVKIL